MGLILSLTNSSVIDRERRRVEFYDPNLAKKKKHLNEPHTGLIARPSIRIGLKFVLLKLAVAPQRVSDIN